IKYPIIYFIAYLITLIILSKIVFNIKASFCSIEEGQKGTSRFACLEELKKQYKAIPESKIEFEGKAGIPISRYEDKILIDESAVNNLIIGTTRSGKGETFVVPTIDIYSRAKIKASLIINDPKGELIAMSKDILEKRGYRVELLNLVQPMNSMSYNPLQLIIDACNEGNYSEAQNLCKTLTYALYYNPNSKDPFWQNSAMSLVNALILALIDDCLKKCNLINEDIKVLKENLKLYYKNNDIELIEKNKKIINKLEENKLKEKSKITLYTVANMLSELGGSKDSFGNNRLDEYFNKLSANSVAKMQYATSKFADGTARGSIFSVAMSELQRFTMDDIAKMTSKNSINLKDIGFKKNNNKPVALFMVTPDYDASNHVISSIFVRQLYYVLAKEASLNERGKCDREVIFLLDEFGNMPVIEGMANIITVCLGRGIKFNLIIQAYSQLKKLYGDDYKTIIGNCGNQIYILTNENETAEEFSKLIGEQTILTYSRAGKILDITKNQTESLDGRRLLKPEELKLQEGECVVVRVIKRRDIYGNKIIPHPIYNRGETSLKYRYEYLYLDFDNENKSLNTIEVNTLHKEVILEDILFKENENNYSNEDEKNINEKANDKVKDHLNSEEDLADQFIEEDSKNEFELIDFKLSQVFAPDELIKVNFMLSTELNLNFSKDINEISWIDFKELAEENIENKNIKKFYELGCIQVESLI
ncbi:VirD4-like conjugal transfer protein, CD1115 family, partial [Clostridium tarantellae]